MAEGILHRDTGRPSPEQDEAGSSAEDNRPSPVLALGQNDRDTGGETGGGTGGGTGGEPGGEPGVEPEGESRRKRRKTQPHPSSDIYVSEFLNDSRVDNRLLTSMKDADAQLAKQDFYEQLGRVLVLNTDTGDAQGDCVVLQSTQNEKIIEMSPFTTLMGYFTKPAQMREGKFRALIMAGTRRKCWRPRIYKQQVHVLQDVRYPSTQAEWARVREVLVSAQNGLGQIRLLEEEIDIDHIMASVKVAVQRARDFKFQHPSELGTLTSNATRPRPKVREGLDKPSACLAPRPGNYANDVNDVNDANDANERTRYKTNRQEGYDQRAYNDHFADMGYDEADSDEGANNFHQNVELHVDSQTFVTTEATLLASPEGSFFHMLMSHFPKSKEFYVDRSPAVFEWVLEYLRELKYMTMFANTGAERAYVGLEALPLPTDTLKLTQLRRECIFYGLPELLSLVDKRLGTQ